MPVKLTVWHPPTPPEPAEKEIFISLVETRKDEVVVRLVDSKGEPLLSGSLMILTPRGYYPVTGVSPTLGIAGDESGSGRMKELSECPL